MYGASLSSYEEKSDNYIDFYLKEKCVGSVLKCSQAKKKTNFSANVELVDRKYPSNSPRHSTTLNSLWHFIFSHSIGSGSSFYAYETKLVSYTLNKRSHLLHFNSNQFRKRFINNEFEQMKTKKSFSATRTSITRSD